MRELKFRCWGIKENKYLKLHSIHLSTSKVIVSYYGVGGGNVSKALKDVVLEQYTGLKDKNGVDIYEGDIVRYWSDNYEVKFGEIEDSDITYYYLGWAMGELSLYESASMCEVIGNIHENKELLK